MNTEQQLRERAEAMLKKHHVYPFLTLIEECAIDAMIDFHKQELQRIGEVVYVPVDVNDNDKPTKSQWYGVINKFGLIVQDFWNGKNWMKHSDTVKWLKKLSLLEVKDFEASDNKNGIGCCDAPFDNTNSI